MEQKIVAALRIAIKRNQIVPSETKDWGYKYSNYYTYTVEEIAQKIYKDEHLRISSDWNLFCKVCNDFKKGIYDSKLHKALA